MPGTVLVIPAPSRETSMMKGPTMRIRAMRFLRPGRRARNPRPLTCTSTEAHVYMDLRPCGCGEVLFPNDGAVTQTGDDLASRYSGVWPGGQR